MITAVLHQLLSNRDRRKGNTEGPPQNNKQKACQNKLFFVAKKSS